MADQINDCQGEGPEFVERAELSRLRSELEEAREIIGELIEGEEDHEGELRELLADAMKTDPSMIHVTHPAVARARAFLNRENGDG